MRLRPDRRDQRRKEAEARQVAYNKLTPQQKLAKLDEVGFAAKKQRARLEAQIAAQETTKDKKKK